LSETWIALTPSVDTPVPIKDDEAAKFVEDEFSDDDITFCTIDDDEKEVLGGDSVDVKPTTAVPVHADIVVARTL
jgi:hypothetical protein